MKTRNGFVSNSSSSSFIVAFPKVPETQEELQEMLFADADSYPDPYPGLGSRASNYPAKQVSETVFRDMQEGPIDDTTLIGAFEGGCMDGSPDMSDFATEKTEPGSRYDWDAYEAADKKFAREAAERFKKENPGAVVFRFEYSDNDGSYFCALEHGDLFRQLPHQRISHH